jgi:hypothetical protein
VPRFVRRNNNPPLYLDPTRRQEWLRCFLLLCARGNLRIQAALAAFACERKDFLPPIHITSSLFICLRSKNYKMNSSAPLQLCGCDKRRFLFTMAFFCALRARTLFPFPSPNLSCKRFWCALLSAGDASSGCGVHQMTAAVAAPANQYFTQQPGRKTNFTAIQTGISSRFDCLLNCRSCYGAQS